MPVIETDFGSVIGPQGPKGDIGAQGLKGESGDTGPQGVKGDTGATGPQGQKGDIGAQGPKGDIGAIGQQGAVGPKGDTGPQGKDGVTPEIGDNENWFIGGVDTGKPSRGACSDLTFSARAYYAEVAVPIDGTVIEVKDIYLKDVFVPNSIVLFTRSRLSVNGKVYTFITDTDIIYSKSLIRSYTFTPSDDSIERTVKIKFEDGGKVYLYHTGGMSSKLGDTTAYIRVIVLSADPTWE